MAAGVYFAAAIHGQVASVGVCLGFERYCSFLAGIGISAPSLSMGSDGYIHKKGIYTNTHYSNHAETARAIAYEDSYAVPVPDACAKI